MEWWGGMVWPPSGQKSSAGLHWPASQGQFRCQNRQKEANWCQNNPLKFQFLTFSHFCWVKHNLESCPIPKLARFLPPVVGYRGRKIQNLQVNFTYFKLLLACFWIFLPLYPPTGGSNLSSFGLGQFSGLCLTLQQWEKVKNINFSGLFSTSIFLFWQLNQPRLAGRWGPAELFWPEGG